jgi:sulfite reductase alpha subunit-like flavoprotein
MNILKSLNVSDYLIVGGVTVILYVLIRSKIRATRKTEVKPDSLRLVASLNEMSPDTNKQAGSQKSLIDKMKASGKNMVVFFGSQTGTGEEFAQRLVKNARLYGIKALVVDPEETDMVGRSVSFG